MKKRSLFLTLILVLSVVLTACGHPSNQKKTIMNLEKASWSDIQKQANSETVNFYLWGGSSATNNYIDNWVAPRLKKETGVTLKRVPLNDTIDVINKLLDEKKVGKKNGSADIIWINGENFKTVKDQNLLWSSFVDKLPNYNKYVDKNAKDMTNDFGEPTNGLEAPWGKAQFVFTYDKNKVKQPPTTMNELKEWVKAHPGKFTYPAPPDFTGSAFIRQVFYGLSNNYQDYLQPNKDTQLNKDLQPVWSYLNDIKPYLWRNGETYPSSSGELDKLYGSGEVWMTISYDPASASQKINEGAFPKSTRTFVLDKGTLSNTHYLSIPFNAPNKAGAMVAINYLLSSEAQMAKLNPKNWGDGMALDPSKLSSKDKKELSNINSGPATLSPEILSQHRAPEIRSSYVDPIEKGWQEHVAKK